MLGKLYINIYTYIKRFKSTSGTHKTVLSLSISVHQNLPFTQQQKPKPTNKNNTHFADIVIVSREVYFVVRKQINHSFLFLILSNIVRRRVLLCGTTYIYILLQYTCKTWYIVHIEHSTNKTPTSFRQAHTTTPKATNIYIYSSYSITCNATLAPPPPLSPTQPSL